MSDHQPEGLQRRLSQRQLTMIAIGGAIGVGLFLGSSITIEAARRSLRRGAGRDVAAHFDAGPQPDWSGEQVDEQFPLAGRRSFIQQLGHSLLGIR